MDQTPMVVPIGEDLVNRREKDGGRDRKIELAG
jgi:hypothetical protein